MFSIKICECIVCGTRLDGSDHVVTSGGVQDDPTAVEIGARLRFPVPHRDLETMAADDHPQAMKGRERCEGVTENDNRNGVTRQRRVRDTQAAVELAGAFVIPHA